MPWTRSPAKRTLTGGGAVNTRPEVVEFMLDLAGYTTCQPLHRLRLLEPSFGGGAFVLAAVGRLLRAFKAAGSGADLADCIRAVELHRSTFHATRQKNDALLLAHGLADAERARLLSAWLVPGDFLLHPLPGRFDVVVGNPPYVRQELIAPPLLADGGQLAFICADRWTKNTYGGLLRAVVSVGFHVWAYVDMTDTPAFEADVVAYPAITLIERAKTGATLVAQRPGVGAVDSLARLAGVLRAGQPSPARLTGCRWWNAWAPARSCGCWVLQASVRCCAAWRRSFQPWKMPGAGWALAWPPGLTRLSSP
ncbi:MAG: hypothetical protein K2W33_01110 [Burkholderiales bacterium]|nr:hypothetical protein [Burkholderiales bacterium]